jgi:8-oxo-dGTP pyrophosphatase MutT (NUDIX family)
METYCDNTSVGVILQNEHDDVLLLNRARFPFGMAAPAGHIDEHGSPEQAAVTEVFEEVGLIVPQESLIKVIDARRIANQCRRINGDHHDWTVYMSRTFSGDLNPSVAETKGAAWISLHALRRLAAVRNVDRSEPGAQALEPVWRDFFAELHLI